MSIQESINRKITKRIFARLKLTKYYDKLLIAYQFLLRELRLHFDFKKKKDIKVFFDYYSSYSHPFYKKRFLDYTKNNDDEDIIVRVTGDNILVDNKIISNSINQLINKTSWNKLKLVK